MKSVSTTIIAYISALVKMCSRRGRVQNFR
jgi:hypothetical protein